MNEFRPLIEAEAGLRRRQRLEAASGERRARRFGRHALTGQLRTNVGRLGS
jgi:hypothetical protein